MLMGQETFTSGSAHLGRSVISLRRKSTISNCAPVPVMCSRSAAEHHESENKHVMMVTNNCVDNVVKIKTQTLKRFQAKVQSDAVFLNPSQLRQGSLFIFQPRTSIKPTASTTCALPSGNVWRLIEGALPSCFVSGQFYHRQPSRDKIMTGQFF